MLRKTFFGKSVSNNLVCLFLCGVATTFMTGCGSQSETNSGGKKSSEVAQQTSGDSESSNNSAGPSEVAQTDADQSVAVNQKPADVKPQRELKGVWYGEAVYDVDAVNAKLAQMEPQQAMQLQAMVNTFSTIVMAAEFRPDSVLEFDMMITTGDGQEMRDRSIGTWAIVEKTDTALRIETKEYKNQSEKATEKVYVYQFIDEDHFQFVPDSISPDLRPFSPRIIFQRVDQELNDAAVAEGQKENVVR